MEFINQGRHNSQCRVFVDINRKKMLMVSHKCGLAVHEHLLTITYRGIVDFIHPITTSYKIGDWMILIEFDEIDKFLEQHDQSQFEKIMITRNPYDRLLSFYTNSFWDHVGPNYEKEKPTHYRTYQKVYGNDYDKIVGQKAHGCKHDKNLGFQKCFNTFMESMFIDPTPGAMEIRQGNGGYGDVHFIPQSRKYRKGDHVFMEDIQFIDVKDGFPNGPHSDRILEFMNLEVLFEEGHPRINGERVPLNVSSGTKWRKEKESWRYFSEEALLFTNSFYKYDFEDLGYEKHLSV